LKRGAVPLDEAVAIAEQVASALEEAHEKGIVHRDLKPANVKVTPDGRVKVLDFGLAKAWTGDTAGAASSAGLSQSPTLAHTGTAAGLILGTAAYMSPEQARGKAVDKRSDVWAFGVLVYEMLSGRRLFEGETVSDTLAAVLKTDPDWSALPAATPPHVRRLLQRCLERDAKRRLRDVGEARIALSEPAEPASRVAAVPGARSLRAVALGAAVVAFGLGFVLGRRGMPAGGPAPAAAALSVTRITSSGNVIGAALSPDGRFVSYVESEQREQALWLRQLATGQALRLLPPRRVGLWGTCFTRDGSSIVFGLKTREDPRGTFFSISTLGGVPRRLVGGLDSAPTFSPDGRRMAWLRTAHPTPEESALMVANADGSGARVLAAVKQPEAFSPIFFAAPDWSPDGRRIATAVMRLGSGEREGSGKVIAVSVEDGSVETLAEPGWVFVAQVAWLSDATGLVAVARSAEQEAAQLWLVPLPGGAPRHVTDDLLEYRTVSLSADGRSLLSVAVDGFSAVWLAPRDGKGPARRLTSSKVDGLDGLDFLPDGRIVYASRDSGRLGLWLASPESGERVPLAGADPDSREPVVAPSGDVFFWTRTAEGGEIRRLASDGSPSRLVARGVFSDDFAVSPDGRFVVFTALRDGESRLLRASAEGGSPEPLTAYHAHTPAFSPDGTRLAFYSLDPATRLYRIAIAPAGGGPPVQTLEAFPPPQKARILFRDEGLYLNAMPDDVANIWVQPLDGRPRRRLTDFQDSFLYDFAVSPDGKSLAWSRGPYSRDAILIQGFQ
jgi:Tol biopolymer transport system component